MLIRRNLPGAQVHLPASIVLSVPASTPGTRRTRNSWLRSPSHALGCSRRAEGRRRTTDGVRVEPTGRREAPPDDRLREIRERSPGAIPAFCCAQRGLPFCPPSSVLRCRIIERPRPRRSGVFGRSRCAVANADGCSGWFSNAPTDEEFQDVAWIEPTGRREAPPDDRLREIRERSPGAILAFCCAQRGLPFLPPSSVIGSTDDRRQMTGISCILCPLPSVLRRLRLHDRPP